jgi:hypothetical protein
VPVADEVIAAERMVVAECYRRLFGGEPLPELVVDLNRRGVRLSPRKRVSELALSRMLSRAALAGLLEHNGELMGELVGVQAVVSREEWERMCALLAGRRPGRPPTPTHPLSGTLRCGLCGRVLSGTTRSYQRPYADGAPRREYRCMRLPSRPGCGRLMIDARVAEQAVDEAMRTRLGDPRRTAKLAAHLAKVDQQRAKIDAEIRTLEASADELAGKTAAWGLARVEKAMAPMLARINALQSQLATLTGPVPALTESADAVAAWVQAQQRGDLAAVRAMVRRALPNLTVAAQTRRNDHSIARFLWDGPPRSA